MWGRATLLGVNVLIVALGSLPNAAVIALIARRLLGAPVGWPRSLLLALFANAAAGPLLTWASGPLSLPSRVPTEGVGAAQLGLVAVLLIAWLVVAEVVALAVLEAFLPTGSLPDPLFWLRSLPARTRRTRRYLQIMRIAAKHGLDRYVRNRRAPGTDVPAAATARALRSALSEAGVTFVKLGQMLSTRPDLLPGAYVAELSRLHSDVPAQSWSVVRGTLEAELGRPVSEVFERVAEKPLAAASVGQVHAAQLPGGEEVVVNVQRSDAHAQVTADLDIVLRLARWMESRTLWARQVGLVALASGFARSLEEELDFTLELRNVQAVAASAADSRSVRVPTVHPQWSTGRLLVMERLPGRALSSSVEVVAGLPDGQRRGMADALLTSVLEQVVVSGVFHADLHAGNVVVDEAGRLGLLDFGSVGRLDRPARQVDRSAAPGGGPTGRGGGDRRAPRPARPQRGLGRAETGARRIGSRHAVRRGDGPGRGQPAVRGSAPAGARPRVVRPSTRGRCVSCVRNAGRHAAAAVAGDRPGDQLSRARPHPVPAAARCRRGAGAARGTAAHGDAAARHAPAALSRITEDLEDGRLTVNLRTFEHPRERAFLTGLVQQIVVALLAATSALGGVLMVTSDVGPMMTSTLPLYAFLGFVLLLFGLVLGARAVVLVFRHRPG